MWGEAPLESISKLGQLGAQPSPGQLRQDLGIGSALDEGIEHHPPGNPQHLAGHRGELYPGLECKTFSSRWTSLVRSSI